MTGSFFLNWAVLSTSLFNTVLLLWLGLTVLLNARRRTWGVWLAAGGLLMGGAFFVSHSAMLGHDMHYGSWGMDFWWRVGWGPVVALPGAWYLVMLWYVGFWSDGQAALRRRHRGWLILSAALALGLGALFLLANPLPSYGQVAQLNLSAPPSIRGVPLLFVIYPAYVVACIFSSLNVLLCPGEQGMGSDQTDGDLGALARQRARPWLVVTSVCLALVSLLVAWAVVWILIHAQLRARDGVYNAMSSSLARFDLVMSALIALSVLLLGQAIVSYEIFTGRTLPRRGFRRSWQSTIVLAAGYSVLVGWSLALQLRMVYSLLLTAILMVAFYALFGWRSFAERERLMGQLRPFAASQQLYKSLVTPRPSTPPDVDAQALLRSLCVHVLGATRAYLVPLGTLTPLVGAPLTFPEEGQVPLPSLAEVTARFRSPQTVCVRLDPGRYGGAAWAVPLWSEIGLIGTLLLGEKRDGGLYVQEEIEIARASGERLLDTLAAIETARRLLALLRQRIAQVKVMDGRGRQVLHDQVLPQVHTALLYLSGLEQTEVVCQAMDALSGAHRQISDLMRDMGSATPHVLAERGLVAALQTLVEADLAGAFERVTWQIAPGAEQCAGQLAPFVGEVVYLAAQELVRNAARHGRGTDPDRSLRVRVTLACARELRLVVEDDGVGLDLRAVRSPDVGERGGNGLRLHGTMLAAIGGSLQVNPLPKGGTRGVIVLPAESFELAAR